MKTRTLFRIVSSRFTQFGGLRVIRIYATTGALWPMIKTIIINPFSLQPYKKAYAVALHSIRPFLREKYGSMMQERKVYYSTQPLEHNRSKIIWFCWLQGVEKAPKIVKVCYATLQRHLTDREIKVIDEKNWKTYVKLPDYVVQKWEKKQIPPANFSDLLRLQLLIRYGGTWIDATVLCTGFSPQNEQYTRSYLDSDLFMFQYTQPGSNQWRGISNWFITACTNNEVLLVLRDMLYAYWKDYDCMIDYYVFHLFFTMLREIYPKEIAAMPYGYSMRSIALGHHWGERFDKEKWERFTSKVCFHKLSYHIRENVLKGNDNYYHYIVDGMETI